MCRLDAGRCYCVVNKDSPLSPSTSLSSSWFLLMPVLLRCLLLASSCLGVRINCASFAPVFVNSGLTHSLASEVTDAKVFYRRFKVWPVDCSNESRINTNVWVFTVSAAYSGQPEYVNTRKYSRCILSVYSYHHRWGWSHQPRLLPACGGDKASEVSDRPNYPLPAMAP